MKNIKAIGLIATVMLAAATGDAGVFTIGGFTFDEANSATTATIVSGSRNLKVQNSQFGKYSTSYLHDASVRSNAFAQFDRSTSIGCLVQRTARRDNLTAKSVALSGGKDEQRSVIELTWGANGVRNLPGIDLVIYEGDNSGGFALSVLKHGASEFSRAKYQFADTHDATHQVNGYAFDLRDFDVAEGELITAIRIQNILTAPALANVDKVDTVNGQGMIIFASDAGYKQGFPLLRKPGASKTQEEVAAANIIYVAALHHIEPLQTSKPVPPGMIAIGGFIFNPANSVKTVVIVEGPANLKDQSSRMFNSPSIQFASAGQDYGTSQLDPGKSLGRLLRPKNSQTPCHLMFPDIDYSPPTPNVHRCTIELTWAGDELRNKPGKDFVIYEVAEWEGFAVSVLKSGSNKWTPYRYQFPNSFEAIRQANAVAFDLSNFGLSEKEAITAIRIRNLFNSEASVGADKVDSATGEGTVIYPNDPKYKSSFPLLMKPDGKEFTTELLDADIVYVIGLHDITPSSRAVAGQ